MGGWGCMQHVLGSEWKDEQTQRGLALLPPHAHLPASGGQHGVCSRVPWPRLSCKETARSELLSYWYHILYLGEIQVLDGLLCPIQLCQVFITLT